MRNAFLHFDSPSFFDDDVEDQPLATDSVEERLDLGAALWALVFEDPYQLRQLRAKTTEASAEIRE